jgi:hypothetical protein
LYGAALGAKQLLRTSTLAASRLQPGDLVRNRSSADLPNAPHKLEQRVDRTLTYRCATR